MQFDLWIQRNPGQNLSVDLLHRAARAYPYLYKAFDYTSDISLEEYFGSLKPDSHWTEELTSWHRQFTSWIPQEILAWWLPWFYSEANLEPMPLAWWQYRALAFIVAKINNQIIGVAALTLVIGDGKQGTGTFKGRKICYEIRGAVIAPAYRGRGIFGYLVEALLAEARMLGHYPTFLATRNAGLHGALLRREVTRPIVPERDGLDYLACWHAPFRDSCTECPLLPGNAIWWRTDLPLPAGECRDRFSEDP
jgi:GNAT superfamily N-acetyltransferase